MAIHCGRDRPAARVFRVGAGIVVFEAAPRLIEPITASAFQMLLGGGVMLLAGTLHGEWSALSFTPRTTGALVT